MGYRKYTAEFKREVLTLAAEGRRSVAQLERELDITPGLMYKWRQRYRVKDEQLQPSADRAEQSALRRLKRELEIVRAGARHPKKAIQVFSRGEP
jgi:transposase-like protein